MAVSQVPAFSEKVLLKDESFFTRAGITNFYRKRVVRWKSSCSLISSLAMRVFHQPVDWKCR
jgi:hypothetical protein